MQNINEIEELVKLIARLPGLGPKSAKRIILKLINNRDELMKPIANALAKVYKNVIRCTICGALKNNLIDCTLHILGGTIASSGQRKEDLLINSLVERVKKDDIDEVIIATSATVEGMTTAHYIKDSLKDTNVKVSKLAQGLPVGGEIESLDDGTLFSAFKNRSWIENNSD